MGETVATNQLMTVLESTNDKFEQVLERFGSLDKKIDKVRDELKQDIAVVDAKVMGLAKRVERVESKLDQVESSLSERIDQVEKRLSREIAEVRADLADHRSNTEMHRAPRKRTLKKVG